MFFSNILQLEVLPLAAQFTFVNSISFYAGHPNLLATIVVVINNHASSSASLDKFNLVCGLQIFLSSQNPSDPTSFNTIGVFQATASDKGC
jgi:hypothetical protein